MTIMKNSPQDKSYFMGRVTASVSHELQNVLAIIRETAGLMQDFLMMGDACDDLGGRLDNSLKSIKNQVIRGVNLTSCLNRFAHTADHLTCAIDVRATLEGLLAITERLTRNKGFSVTLDPGSAPSVECDPVMLQTICFLSIETLINALPPGQALHVTLETRDKGCLIRFSCPEASDGQVPPLTGSPHWSVLQDACQTGNVALSSLDGGVGICLSM